MPKLVQRARELADSWGKRPSRGVASSIRIFYGQKARELPLPARSALCIALGEAAELQGHFENARWLYASAVAAATPANALASTTLSIPSPSRSSAATTASSSSRSEAAFAAV